MSLKDFLNVAKVEDAAYKRQQEIIGLDLNPEEYMLLREDKSRLGLELLDAILEAKGNTEWVVDASTHRLMRRSTSNASQGKFSSLVNRLNGAGGGQFSVGLTSNSKRFFLKVYRDYLELSEFDLVGCKFITDAISVLDSKIFAIEDQRDREKYLALERENLTILAESKSIQELLDQAHEADKRAFFDGEQIIKNLSDFIVQFSSGLPNSELILDEIDFNHQELFEITDDVPCKNTLNPNGKIVRSISNSYILECINFVNLIHVDPIEFSFSQVNGSFNVSGLNQRQHGVLWNFFHNERRYIEQPYSNALGTVREKLSKIILQMQSPRFLISIWDIEFDGESEEVRIEKLKSKISEMAENVRILHWKLSQKG